MKILFLCLYPENTAPSQRFRFEQFFPYFTNAGIEFDVDSFYTETAYRQLYKKGGKLKKAYLITIAYIKRMVRLARFKQYDFIFIQRAAAPVGPAFFETVLAKWMRKKIIYDFDDAIWMPQDGKGGRFFRWLKSYGKVGRICELSHKVIVGNEFLANYARKFTDKVLLVPTVVDMSYRYSSQKESSDSKPVIIGWTGSHSTLRYLLMLGDVLAQFDKRTDVLFLIVADKVPEKLESSNIKFRKWQEETEINDLLAMDIGLMPLVDNEWTRGKCGFKAIQYMALGIPALVSPVGVNKTIVDDGINGFICHSSEEWVEKIKLLCADPILRKKMGEAAKVKIEQGFSVQYAFPLILSALKDV